MVPNILNYTDICSNALLSIVDNDDSDITKNDFGEYEIEISRKFISSLFFYTKSLCYHYSQFGKNTIVVKSCVPSNNWRQDERGSPIKQWQYLLTDYESFKADMKTLDHALDQNWKRLKGRVKDHLYVENFEIDYIDWITIIKNFNIGGDFLTIHPTQYYFLRDANSDYTHMHNIPDRIKTSAEIVLKREQLII